MKSYKELIDDIFYILDSEIHAFLKLEELKKIHGDELILKILTEITICTELVDGYSKSIVNIKKEVLSKIIEEERNLKLNNLLNK